jgi:hypothetical protein
VVALEVLVNQQELLLSLYREQLATAGRALLLPSLGLGVFMRLVGLVAMKMPLLLLALQVLEILAE